MSEDKKQIGKITHFFSKISVAVIELSNTLNVGDRILIEGHGNSFEQDVESMQIEHEEVEQAAKGQSIGMKVEQPVKVGDLVFLA